MRSQHRTLRDRTVPRVRWPAVQGSRFRAYSLGISVCWCRVPRLGLGEKVWGSRLGVHDSCFRMLCHKILRFATRFYASHLKGLRIRVQDLIHVRVHGLGFGLMRSGALCFGEDLESEMTGE